MMSHVQPEEQKWVEFKPMLRVLWKQKGSTTASISKQMKEKHGFEANKNAYDRHFKAWGWQKNLTAEEWSRVEHVVKKRKRDQGKESEVRVDGAVVQASKRIKRHRLSYLEQLRIQQQEEKRGEEIELPNNVTVLTPVSVDDSDVLFLDGLPWIRFVMSLKSEAEHYLGGESIPISLSGLDFTRFALASTYRLDDDFPALKQLLEPILGPSAYGIPILKSIHSCVNGGFIGKERATVSDYLEDLNSVQLKNLARLLAACTDPCTSILTLVALLTVFRKDDVTTARILLPKVAAHINSSIHIEMSNCATGFHNCHWLVDKIQSSAMAKLFSEFGGDLKQWNDPIRKIYHDTDGRIMIHGSSVPRQSEATPTHDPCPWDEFTGSREDADEICRMLIELEHPHVLSSLSTILTFSTVRNCGLVSRHCSSTLIWHAIVWITTYKEDNEKMGWLLGSLKEKPIEENHSNGSILALAAAELSLFIMDLLPRKELLTLDGATALIRDDKRHVPEVGTALQFALNHHLPILDNDTHGEISKVMPLLRQCRAKAVSLLLDEGAEAVSCEGSNLPPPIHLAFIEEDKEIISLVLDEVTWPVNAWYSLCLLQPCCHESSWDFAHHKCAIHPLGIAVRMQDREVIDDLLSLGADINEPLMPSPNGCDFPADRYGVHSVIREALLLDDIELAVYLFERGAKIKVSLRERQTGHSHAEAECYYSAAHLLVKLGTDAMRRFQVSAEDLQSCFLAEQYCQSPFDEVWTTQYVEAGRCHEMLQTLIDLGADINLKGTELTPLALAIQANCMPCVDILLYNMVKVDEGAYRSIGSGASCEMLAKLVSWTPPGRVPGQRRSRFDRNFTVSHNLVREVLMGIVSRIRQTKDVDTNTKKIIDAVTQLGANFSAPCMVMVMEHLCSFEPKSGIDEWKKCVVHAARLFIVAGIPINSKEKGGSFICKCLRSTDTTDVIRSCLGWSVTNNNAELRDYLLASGAFINEANQNDVLHEAARENNVEALKALIAAGGNVHRLANRSPHWTVLQEAVLCGSLETVRFLLNEEKISPNEPGQIWGGENGLKFAAIQSAASEGSIDIVRELMRAGADVDSGRLENGVTPLMSAAVRGKLDMVAFLIQSGADISASESGAHNFKIALEGAQLGGFPVLAQYLQDQRRAMHGI